MVVMTLGNSEVEEETLLKIEIKLVLSLFLGVGREAILENRIGPLRAMKNKSSSHYRHGLDMLQNDLQNDYQKTSLSEMRDTRDI